MATSVIDLELELPAVANRYGVSTDAMRRLVRRHQELNKLVRRLRPSGTRLFGPAAVELTGRLLADREATAGQK